LVGLDAAGLSSSSSLTRGLSAAALWLGVIGLASGALMLIPGAIGWALAPGPSLREQNELASVRALHSRRVALLQSAAANPLSFAPPAAVVSSLSLSF
jgi:hypothetical protein